MVQKTFTSHKDELRIETNKFLEDAVVDTAVTVTPVKEKSSLKTESIEGSQSSFDKSINDIVRLLQGNNSKVKKF